MMTTDHELDALRVLSERVGNNPLLVQAAGGNTSLKDDDGILWIKASGTWLANAVRDDIMVPVRLEPLLAAIARDDPEAEKPHGFVVADRNPSGLRPSIETTVHALMASRVVVHVHCVETIALAVRQDAKNAVAPSLDGLDWALVPYLRPGLPLARAISEVAEPETRVLILGNHGLVVAGDTVEETATLLSTVTARLKQPTRPARAPDMAALEDFAAGTAYRPAPEAAMHATACDPVSLDVARGGSLYPDHVIFLGPGIVVAEDGEMADATAWRATDSGLPEPKAILLPDAGVVVHKNASDAAGALVRCLADVTARIPDGAPVRYLTHAENAELLDWDAEKYRQALNRARQEAP